jgi:aspartate aminotransferase-like enzyme
VIDRPLGGGAGGTPLLLMTPGPTRVPDRVLRAGARPMIHHRTPEFSRELGAMIELLGPLFGTAKPVLPVHTTGRGAMEAAICNLFSPGDVIGVSCNGKFGIMWASLAESYGLVVHRLATDWAKDIDPNEIERFLGAHPTARAVTIPYGETSSGGRTDVKAVCQVARRHGDVLVMVDAISSLGGMPFAFDEWEVDVAVAASQKCLMSSPGLAFAVLSDRAWAACERAKLPRNYWNFADIRRETTKPRPETPGTAPVHLVLQVAEALRMIHEEGLATVQRRHEQMAARVREGAAALGLGLQCPTLANRTATVTGIMMPVDVAPKDVRDALKARGILTAAGMGPFVDTAFRIGHMGDIRLADVERTLTALRESLPARTP